MTISLPRFFALGLYANSLTRLKLHGMSKTDQVIEVSCNFQTLFKIIKSIIVTSLRISPHPVCSPFVRKNNEFAFSETKKKFCKRKFFNVITLAATWFNNYFIILTGFVLLRTCSARSFFFYLDRKPYAMNNALSVSHSNNDGTDKETQKKPSKVFSLIKLTLGNLRLISSATIASRFLYLS